MTGAAVVYRGLLAEVGVLDRVRCLVLIEIGSLAALLGADGKRMFYHFLG